MSTQSGMRGFTLVELMIVVVLLAIVATVAVPNFTTFIQNNRSQTQADELLRLVQYTRSQAVASHKSYQLVKNSSTGNWEAGPAPLPNQTASVERTMEARSDVSVESTATSLSFNAMGVPGAATHFVVCYGSRASSGYRIDINQAGSIRGFARGMKDTSNKLSDCSVQ